MYPMKLLSSKRGLVGHLERGFLTPVVRKVYTSITKLRFEDQIKLVYYLPDKFFTQSELTFVFSTLEAFPGIVDVGNRLTLLQKLISIYVFTILLSKYVFSCGFLGYGFRY